MDEAKDTESLSKKINLSDAVDWVKLAWDSVRESTIKKCFTLCTAQSELPQIFDDFITEEQEVAELGRQANVEVAINGDQNVPTCDELDGNWEQDLYTTVTNKKRRRHYRHCYDIDEEERLEVPPVPINECLHLIARLKIRREN
jgi:hypothetical protein